MSHGCLGEFNGRIRPFQAEKQKNKHRPNTPLSLLLCLSPFWGGESRFCERERGQNQERGICLQKIYLLF